MKDKPHSIRTYDNEGFRCRAACICVRSQSESEILLISSSRHPDKWVVPGGGIEPEEEPNLTATREVLEEAGVTGILGRRLGLFEHSENKHRTHVYVLMVTQELDEWQERSSGRARQWFTVDEALEKLSLYKPEQQRYIQELLSSKRNI